MNVRCRAPTLALAAFLTVAVLSGHVRAVERACGAARLEGDAAVVARFPELLDRLRSELSSPTELDACARIELFGAGGDAIEIVVRLPDGRSARRSAARREDVVPTVRALLLLPQPAPQLAAAAKAAAPRPARTRARRPPRVLETGVHPGVESVEPRSLGIELSLVGGARMGEGQVAVGLGALSLLETYGWLFGFVGRVDRYEMPGLADPELALELGVLAGKRFHFESVALDVLAGPAIAAKNLASSETEVVRVDREMGPRSSPPPPQEGNGTGPVPRLLVGAHAGFSPRSVLRSFVGLEASVGPARNDTNESSSRFPVFALGLVLGGTVGTR